MGFGNTMAEHTGKGPSTMAQRTLKSETIFTGNVFSVHADQVMLPHGHETRMEVVRHPGSVVLLPMADPQHLFLVRQYRYAIDRHIWELPAGSLDPGESPEQAALREAHEEIGQLATRLERVGEFFPSPGFCDEQMIFFKLTGLYTPPHAAHADEDEDIEVSRFSLPEAETLVRDGHAPDMKTALGLGLLRR